MSSKYALIIGNTDYTDPGLAQLTAPGKDAEDFGRILRDPEICAFNEVITLLNQPEHLIRRSIDVFFDQKKPDDLLVFYFSGHGVRDELGALYLAVKNTDRLYLRSTAIKSDFIREAMDQSRSKRQVLILDCCNSGAFAHGTKSATGLSIGTASAFEGTGYGRVVLTASDATQFAWEGNKVIGETVNSLFTHFLIKGLEGDADKDRDGTITVDDLYDYAYEQVVIRTPKQTPGKWSYKQRGEIPFREPSEAQKEQLRLARLKEQKRRQQEEAERLVRIRLAQEAAETRKAQLIAEKEAAEKLALTTKERIAQEAARLETARAELARQKAAHEGLERSSRQETIRLNIERIFQNRKQSTLIITGCALAIGLGIIFLENINDRSGRNHLLRVPTGPTSERALELPPPASTIPASSLFTPTAIPFTFAGTPVDLSSKTISVQNANQIHELARWGRGIINQVTYSADGTKLIVVSSIGIYTYEANSLEELGSHEADIGIASNASYRDSGIAFSSDKTVLVSTSSIDNTLEVRNIADGTLIQKIDNKSPYGDFDQIAISPDGRLLATADYFGESIRLWGVKNGQLLQTMELDTAENDDEYFDKVAFSPDGEFVISMSDFKSGNTHTNFIRIWRTSDGKMLQKLKFGSTSSVDHVSISPNGNSFAYELGTVVNLVRISDGMLIGSFKTGRRYGSINSIAFSPDGNTLAAGSDDNTISVWRLKDGELMRTLTRHESDVVNIAFSPDGHTLVSALNDGSIQLWRVNDGVLLKTFSGFSSYDLKAAFSPNQQTMAFVLPDESIRISSITDGRTITTITAQADSSDEISFSPDGRTLASISDNNDISIWNVTNGTLEKNFEGTEYRVRGVRFSPNGDLLASIAQNTIIRLWNIEKGTSIQVLEDMDEVGDIRSVTFSPDGKALASGASDGKIYIWSLDDLSGTTRPTELTASDDTIYSMAFSPDGQVFASGSGSKDHTIYLWNTSDGSLLQNLDELTGYIVSLAFSPDGQILAASSSDRVIKLWNLQDGSLIHTLEGHTYLVNNLAFSENGQLLLSSSEDGTIRLWGVVE